MTSASASSVTTSSSSSREPNTTQRVACASLSFSRPCPLRMTANLSLFSILVQHPPPPQPLIPDRTLRPNTHTHAHRLTDRPEFNAHSTPLAVCIIASLLSFLAKFFSSLNGEEICYEDIRRG